MPIPILVSLPSSYVFRYTKVNLQALDNAVNNVKRELSTRFDFKHVKSEITFDRNKVMIVPSRE